MTEKRFILVEYVNKGLFIQDNANDETQYFQGSKASLEKVVDLLNSLTDENEQLKEDNDYLEKRFKEEEWHYDHIDEDRDAWKHKCQELEKKNGELKKGMIGVVDRYIKNVECNPPSSARTYRKIKGALINIREDLRNLIGALE